MSNPVEYLVVNERDTASLASAVNSYIAQGWRPQGGVAVADGGSSMDYCQALVRERKEK